MPSLAIVLSSLSLLLLLSAVAASNSDADASRQQRTKAADLACGACRAVSRSLLKAYDNYLRQAADAKKATAGRSAKDAVGDVVEGVCRNLAAHARMRHPEKPDRWGIVPLKRDTDDQPVDLSRVDADAGLANWLRMRCEELLDDREDVVVRLLLSGDADQLEATLCGRLAIACTEEQLALEFTPPLDPIVASGAKRLDLKFVKGGEL